MCDSQIRCPRCLGTNYKEKRFEPEQDQAAIQVPRLPPQIRRLRGRLVHLGAAEELHPAPAAGADLAAGHLPGGGHVDEVADGLHPADL